MDNRNAREFVIGYFNTILPHDPLDITQHLLPWWNEEIFEEYGVKVPLGLLRNRELVRNPEKAFKFFSERMECRIVSEDIKGEVHYLITFEGGHFLPGENFELTFPRLTFVGIGDRDCYMVTKNDQRTGSEIFANVDRTSLENATIYVDRTDISNMVRNPVIIWNQSRLVFPGDGNADILLYRDLDPQDRLSVIEEVKKSILWRALN
jgi:hypothetical protein